METETSSKSPVKTKISLAFCPSVIMYRFFRLDKFRVKVRPKFKITFKVF